MENNALGLMCQRPLMVTNFADGHSSIAMFSVLERSRRVEIRKLMLLVGLTLEPDSPDFLGGNLTVRYLSGGTADDRLTFQGVSLGLRTIAGQLTIGDGRTVRCKAEAGLQRSKLTTRTVLSVGSTALMGQRERLTAVSSSIVSRSKRSPGINTGMPGG